jgi:hypothetical protein
VAHAEKFRRAEVERSISRFGVSSDRERAMLDASSATIVKKLLHQPIVQLKRGGPADRDRIVELALGELRALPSAIDAVAARACRGIADGTVALSSAGAIDERTAS